MAKKRAKVQKIKKADGSFRYRIQFVDPLDPSRKERVSIEGDSEADVIARAKESKQRRRDYKAGIISDGQLRAAIEVQIRGGPMPIKEAWDKYVKRCAPRTARLAKIHWNYRWAPMWASRSVVELTAENLGEWYRKQKELGLSDKTLLNAWELMHAAIMLQVNGRKIGVPAWEGFRIKLDKRRPRREACRNIDEVKRLIIKAREIDARRLLRGQYSDLAFRIGIVFFCGFRNGEAAGSGWDDIDWRLSNPVLHIIHQAVDGWRRDHPTWTRPLDPPKDGERELVLHENAVGMLLELKRLQEKFGLYRPDGPIFPANLPPLPTGGGQWRSGSECIKNKTEMRKIWAAAGLPNVERVVVHSLRHSMGTLEAAASGNDLYHVSLRLGHTRSETSQQYIHSTTRDLPKSNLPRLMLGMGEDRRHDVEVSVLEGKASEVELVHVPPSIVDLCIVTPTFAREFAQQVRGKGRAAQAAEQIVFGDFESAFRAWERVSDKTNACVLALCEELLEEKKVQHHRGRKDPVRPQVVTDMAERARQRAKAEQTQKGATDEQRKQQGTYAHRGVLANWGKFIRKKAAELRACVADGKGGEIYR